MPSLVTRFHLLIFGVTIAMVGVIVAHVPASFAFPAHWRGSTADILWPRDRAIAAAPLLQIAMMAAFFLLGRALTKNHFAKTQHILDPVLTVTLATAAACQLSLVFLAIGSDLDFFRLTAFGLAAILAIFAVVIFEAERHSYAGLRMPWRIGSDRAWVLVHRLTGIISGAAAVTLAWLAWADPGPAVLVASMTASLLAIPVVAALTSLLSRRL
ncbi:SdpI family protein [Devosia rhizoryzae]|uniref:SdpI family protein n=1 Tax=Devosia rhizoryzae TaxID=2774137 RepID=A0ABX7C9J6_9HYPH|nr:SdpI family protein [Devosia rhizoryzae]QQR40891.1 hypothetical protein JI748_07895 [Devosia rhizoryzae]